MKKLKYLLAFHRCINLTYTRYKTLKIYFKNDFETAWKSDLKTLKQSNLDLRALEKFALSHSKIEPEKEQDLLKKSGAETTFIEDTNYPEALKNIPHPPVLLFRKGNFTVSDFPSVSVVGSRQVTHYGKQALQEIVGYLVAQKITIVSGLAYGVDSLSHKLALEKKARTIGVLGCGIDELYPKNNQYWVDKMLEEKQGVILSEFLPQTKARPEYFPQRNRIVAGLSRATLVIEAALKSGSLITAHYAHEYNREVLAVPGDIFAPNAAGCNELITKNIAQAATSGEQVFENLGFIPKSKQVKTTDIPTVGIEADILKSFGGSAQMHIDQIVETSGLPLTTISSNLMLLELRGWVKNLGDQVYVRLV